MKVLKITENLYCSMKIKFSLLQLKNLVLKDTDK